MFECREVGGDLSLLSVAMVKLFMVDLLRADKTNSDQLVWFRGESA